MDTLSKLKTWFTDHRDAVVQEYFQFLSFKSIATDPSFDQETKACANWLVDQLNSIGLEVERWETSGQPVIFAQHTKAGNDRPTVLIYHHYDVQPVDPLKLWKSDPFVPEIRNGKVFARGAQDNKGQCFYSLMALKAFFELFKECNFNLKVFIEGEEESGSVGTKEVFKTKAKELQSDYMLAVDVGIPGPKIPAINLGIRGILTLEIQCIVADGDMHSGTMGGVIYNPIRALSIALSKLWDENGKVAIPHFFDDVETLSKEEKKTFYLDLDEAEIQKNFGAKVFGPEPGYTIGESVCIRPTVEINGICGGYTGEGFKTVLPATASAKISCRLVPHQNPEKILEDLKTHLRTHLPKGIEIAFSQEHGSAAFRSSPDSMIAKVAAKAYEEVLGKPCKQILAGGSIPIVVDLAKITGAEVVMMGYALDSDQIHAPNEHFGLDRFEQGFLTMGTIFCKLNEQS